MRQEAHRSLGNIIKTLHLGCDSSIPPKNIFRQLAFRAMIPNLGIRETLHARLGNAVYGYTCGMFFYVDSPCVLGGTTGRTQLLRVSLSGSFLCNVRRDLW